MMRAVMMATAGMAAALVLTPDVATAKEVTCAVGAQLKAKNGNTKSTITFTNRTPDKQTVYWIDYDGKKHKYQELDPGESYDQPTFLTHPWLVTGNRGKCVGYYLAEGTKTAVEPGIAGKLQPKNRKKTAAARPRKEEPKAVAKKQTPEISDDDFESFEDEVGNNTQVARRKLEPAAPAETNDLSDTDFDDGDDSEFERDDPQRDGREEFADADRDDAFDQDRDDDVAIAEPLPRRAHNRRSNGLGWGADEPLRDEDSRSRNWRCSEYSSRTEEAICNDRRLSRMDDELERLYQSLLRSLPGDRRAQLRNRQRDWLEDREQCGPRLRCIEHRTERRLARLNRRMERVVGRRNAGVQTLCKNGFVAIGGRCLRRGSRRTGLICVPGFVDNGSGQCVPRNRSRAGGNGALPIGGRSIGAGRIRDIPGLDGRRVGTLRSGERVTVLESTGEFYRNYEWFKVRHSRGTGYQWGGTICTNRRVRGAHSVCR